MAITEDELLSRRGCCFCCWSGGSPAAALEEVLPHPLGLRLFVIVVAVTAATAMAVEEPKEVDMTKGGS